MINRTALLAYGCGLRLGDIAVDLGKRGDEVLVDVPSRDWAQRAVAPDVECGTGEYDFAGTESIAPDDSVCSR